MKISLLPLLPSLLLLAASPMKASEGANSSLLRAAQTGNVKACEKALKAGAKIETRDAAHDFSPLMWATWKNKPAALRFLIAAGADVNAASHPKQVKPLVLGQAGPHGDLLAMTFFVRNQGVTALLLAASTGSDEAVGELLKNGANTKARPVSGESPLMAACFKGNVKTVKLLLQHGANPNETTPAAGAASGPLTVAILGGHADCLRDLIARGACVTTTLPMFGNYEGMALRAGYPKIAEQISVARKCQEKRHAGPAKPGNDSVSVLHPNGTLQIIP